MAESILIPVDESPQADAALEYAVEHFPDADLTALHVVHVPEGYWKALGDDVEDLPHFERVEEHGREILEETRERAEELGVDVETVMEVGPVARTIIEYAEENDSDGIVIGSHGRRGTGLFVGSVAEYVVRRSAVPVVVV